MSQDTLAHTTFSRRPFNQISSKSVSSLKKKTLYAWCANNGVITFACRRYKSKLPIAYAYARSRHYVSAIKVLARLAYDNKTALVPGVPEGDTPGERYGAFESFESFVVKHIMESEQQEPTPDFALVTHKEFYAER